MEKWDYAKGFIVINDLSGLFKTISTQQEILVKLRNHDQNNNIKIKLSSEHFCAIQNSVLKETVQLDLVEKFKNLVSVNSTSKIEGFFSLLSPLDYKTFGKCKVGDLFKTKTLNKVINEVVENEEIYENKILHFLTEAKLGKSGKGFSTAEILSNIGGNAITLRSILISLTKKRMICGIGTTKSKRYVISTLRGQAQKKFIEDLNR